MSRGNCEFFGAAFGFQVRRGVLSRWISVLSCRICGYLLSLGRCKSAKEVYLGGYLALDRSGGGLVV